MLIKLGMDFRNWLLATSAFRMPHHLAELAYTNSQIARILDMQEKRKGLIERFVK